jgi:hypothetical protein
MKANRKRYLASVSAELTAQANRVRDLIGDAHWLEEGHHKEYLVKYALDRHVPTGVRVSRGFVVHPLLSEVMSREQDLLFTDTHALAPIFDQGGLAISFPQQVLAALAIKTKFSVTELEDACSTLHTVRRVAARAGISSPPWCGILFFEPDTVKSELCTRVGQRLAAFEAKAESLGSMRGLPDVVAIAGSAAFIVDTPGTSLTVRGFGGDGVVVLLQRLLSHIANQRDSNAAELEEFVSEFDLEPLAGSPFSRPQD